MKKFVTLTVMFAVSGLFNTSVLVANAQSASNTPAGWGSGPTIAPHIGPNGPSVVPPPASHKPVITRLTAPSHLEIDEEGTWTLSAFDPLGGSLTYTVDWGDTPAGIRPQSPETPFEQTSEFTHAYGVPGTYKVTIVVENEEGLTAKTSVTVRVGDKAAEDAAEAAAEAAVRAYESGPLTTLDEVVTAEGLKAPAENAVNQVLVFDVRQAFLDRIDARADEIADARAALEAEADAQAAAEAAVRAYESGPLTTLAEVVTAEGKKAPAETAVALVHTASVRNALTGRIAARAAEIAAARAALQAEADAQAAAEAAVRAYESGPLTTLGEVAAAEALKAPAEAAVALVHTASVRDALTARISTRAAQIADARAALEEAAAQAAAEAAVSAYESGPITTLGEVAAAEALKAPAEAAVALVHTASVHDALTARISTRAAAIAAARTELEAEAAAETAVSAYEAGPLTTLAEVAAAEALKAPAEAAVALVHNVPVHDALAARIAARAAQIAAARAILESTPVITGTTAPTNLEVGEEGTWTVSVIDPLDGTLSYSVDWGDSPAGIRPLGPDDHFVQTGSFSHTYSAPGVYTVTITVENEAGHTSQTRFTVNVTAPAGTAAVGTSGTAGSSGESANQTRSGDQASAFSVSNLKVTGVSKNKAQINWSTGVKADSTVWASTVSPVIASSGSPAGSKSKSESKHKIKLDHLAANTTYYVVVQSKDKNGNTVTSNEVSFTTKKK